jgi:nucleoside-diphosphate-sugar epimerase
VRVLIIGCGYVGLPLARELVARGHEVFGVRRSAEGAGELAAAGIKPLVADIARAADLARLPGPFDWVVNTVSSSRGGAEDYREVYLRGTQNLIGWLASSPPRRFVYTSSTSVYAQTDGSVVDETSPAQPSSETSRVLVETENLLLTAAREKNFPAVILRVAGIYGPERGHLFQQFLRDEARIAGKGERIINMIHRDDVVGLIMAALEHGQAGAIYNAADDEPVTQLEFFRFLAGLVGKPMPPFATEAENAARKRGLTNKRVANRRVKSELGYEFRYPNFRVGYAAEAERLGCAGKLKLPRRVE